MERVNIFFLHGFLGRPSDWQKVLAALPSSGGLTSHVVDYFKMDSLGPRKSLKQWGEEFVSWAQEEASAEAKNILVGYSLGGRLALHALEKRPAFWHKVVLLSTNPGFDDQNDSFNAGSEERRERWLNDAYWAEEFLKSPWEDVIKSWNAQPVFGKSLTEPVRKETDYRREDLSLALTQWSLAQQKNMRPLIQQNVDKIDWVVGENDSKYMSLSKQLSQNVRGLRWGVLPRAHHRVLFDDPQGVADLLSRNLQLPKA